MSLTYDPVQQRADAMQHANAVRAAIGQLKRDIHAPAHRDGCLRAAKFLLDPDDLASAIRTRPLLKAIRQMGDRKAETLMSAAGIVNADKRVRDLTPRQRRALSTGLRLRATS
jgi:hypothetical protein